MFEHFQDVTNFRIKQMTLGVYQGGTVYTVF